MFRQNLKLSAKGPLLITGAFVTAALLGWTACASHSVRADDGTSGKTETPPSASALDGKLAPDFALKDVDGRTVHLSDYRNKVVVLDFWATWCGPCKIEIPWFQEFERQRKDQGFAVLGIAMDDEGWSAVKPFLKELNVNYRVLLGDDKTADLYQGIEALPTTFLIDRNGRVDSTHVGLTARKDFEDAIDRLLHGPAKVGEAHPKSDAGDVAHAAGAAARAGS